MRRSLGFVLNTPERTIRSFVTFMEQQAATHITIELALQWATMPPGTKPEWWATRLTAVRGFAKYLVGFDPRTEVPPLGLLPSRFKRRSPFIYSTDDILHIIQAARQLPPITSLRPWTYSTLFGLLAVTGLRISEIVALDRDDVDLDAAILSIRRTKFGKSRLVPVHDTVRGVLAEYAEHRETHFPKPRTPAFFVSRWGMRLNDYTVRYNFVQVSKRIGLRAPSDRRGPRLHDFRHGLAVATLVRWYREGLDVERQMPLLSTFLGHTHVADTYWYLSAAPELLALAGARLERTLGDLP